LKGPDQRRKCLPIALLKKLHEAGDLIRHLDSFLFRLSSDEPTSELFSPKVLNLDNRLSVAYVDGG
jgi:hypothetical protein